MPLTSNSTGHCIVIASIGRSGSTVLYKSILGPRQGFLSRKLRKRDSFQQDLAKETMRPGAIIKTHDFPEPLLRRSEKIKVVFCFGSALEAALSVYGKSIRNDQGWIRNHLEHLHATGGIEDLLSVDILRMGEQILSWATFQAVPVLCVKYDALWSNQEEIGEFCGRTLELPVRKGRTPKDYPEEIVNTAIQTYGPIDAIADQLPDIFLGSKHFDPLLSPLAKDFQR